MSMSPVLPRPGPLRSPVGLSHVVILMLGVAITADLFSLVVGFNLHAAWSDVLAPGYDGSSGDSYERVETLYGLSGGMQGLSLLVCAVLFISWFHRVRGNAQTFAPDAHSKSSGWAVWGWLVPVVSLWYPRRIALDIWAASGPEPHLGLAKPPSRALINAWWTLWLATLFFGNLASRRYEGAVDGADVQRAVAELMVSDVINIAAAVLAILVVRRLTSMQQEKARAWMRLYADQPAGTPDSALPRP
ncbi:DUF4328 domain-containing protein [Streptomyces sp. NPDC006638]|uniref:DUF4328 domain-containing protein n=1 Tax=Streptomyces sp. NPDC006638 TaxID=3157183 RepID=UPI0033A3615A